MKKVFAVSVIALLVCGAACADVFNLGPGLTNLEMVTVGDAGNPGDTRSSGYSFGGVAYTYQIGKFEVTTGQYCDFLNHKAKSDPYGLYSEKMSYAIYHGCNIWRTGTDGSYVYTTPSDWANRPVNYVDFSDACRFVNWLTNGQGDGDTETGSYALGVITGSVVRSANARWVVPTEDEWYKAAYYKGGPTDYFNYPNWWAYPTKSNSGPSWNIINPDPGNNGCFSTATLASPYYRTEAGEFENSESAYGTYDQGGNVEEWLESVYPLSSDNRAIRGGSYKNGSSYSHFTFRLSDPVWASEESLGFRVAYIPEPSSLLALLTGIGLIGLRRRLK